MLSKQIIPCNLRLVCGTIGSGMGTQPIHFSPIAPLLDKICPTDIQLVMILGLIQSCIFKCCLLLETV